ncbi:hypothetical protein CLIB1423_02S02718 [[Candida] railenensis]|uniref:Uncharacterized protein n=1 Tax=[Candida] railenensis TaxID=45579 RepID=A0A9P0QKA6_9ASCO|nr:hypothetical protein CLIB1423_02S02718 [[Candida] railenensis]
MVMSVSLEPTSESTREAFQSLSLSIPIDTAKYQYICQFLERVLSLKDERSILIDTSEGVNLKLGCVELLPNVSFPLDAWVNDQIVVRDIRIKNSLLNEINSLIEKEVANTQSGTPVRIDGNVISYYEKLLVAYRFLEAPIMQVNSSPTNSTSYRTDYPLREEEDEENDDVVIARTISNQSSTNSLSKTYHSLFGNGNSANTNSIISGPTLNHNSSIANGTSLNGNNNISNGNALNNNNGNNINSHNTGNNNMNNNSSNNSGHRLTFTRKKRFSTLLGQSAQASDTNLNEQNGYYEDEEKKHQNLNGLLAKSRIYNKLKKNRDSSASSTSVISNPTSLSHSNRNSIATTMTSSTKRRGSIQTPEMLIESRSSVIYGGSSGGAGGVGMSASGGYTSASRHSSIYSIPGLTPSQRQDIQKSKFDYYVQLKKLLRLTKQVLAVINDSFESRDMLNLVEFIKRYVMKFIVIDMNEILLEYVEHKELSLYRK